jgi:hypothetical protein
MKNSTKAVENRKKREFLKRSVENQPILEKKRRERYQIYLKIFNST